MDTKCDKGSRYPVLVNSISGSFVTEVYCNGVLDIGIYQYVFTDFKTLDSAVRKGTLIGFAVPLADGRFKVVRFDLTGSVAAITGLLANAANRSKQVHHGTRDQTF